MEVVNVHEAKTQLSKLLARAHSGEEIIIAKSGMPYAKLVPITKVKSRSPGIAKGEVTDDFFKPLPEEELKHWE